MELLRLLEKMIERNEEQGLPVHLNFHGENFAKLKLTLRALKLGCKKLSVSGEESIQVG
jgi:hypothetical protein